MKEPCVNRISIKNNRPNIAENRIEIANFATESQS